MTDTQNNIDSSVSDSTNNQVGTENQADNTNQQDIDSESTSDEVTENESKGSESDKEVSNKSDSKKESQDEKSDDDKKDEDEEEDEEDIDRDYSKLTFKDPDNVDQDLLKEATSIFEESNLSVEQAQKIVQLQEKALEKINARYSETVDGWLKEGKKDPEFGGKDFEKNLSAVNKAMRTYGSEALGKFLDDYRFGDHPEVIRMFYRIGLTLQEDKKAAAGVGTKPSSDGKTLAERMYPNNQSSGQF